MQFNEVTLNDKALFNSYLQGRKRNLITYCFSSFYLWREWDPYSWAIVEDALVVKSNYKNLDTICVPISADDQAVLRATEAMIKAYQQENKEFIISEVSADDLLFYEKYWPGRFVAEDYLDGANYIYLQSDLAHLPGKKFDGKRNQINRFKRNYPEYKLLPITKDLVNGCKEELNIWMGRHDANDFELQQEYQGSLDALDHLDELDCEGAALLIGDKVCAFTIGEPLNADTYCVHIEKGDINIPGVYQAINCFYAREYTEGYQYINRAEDMGSAGLRKAKTSYNPYRLEHKYYLRLSHD